MYNIKESFEWMAAPEFQVVNTGKNTVTIRGQAVRKGQISRNKRKYIDEEMKMAARTWIGTPATINHAPWNKNHPMYDSRKVAGNVRWMEYNKGAMEYQIDIKKQPYVDMIRNKSVEVRGVSIEADYIYNRCSRCGKHFYTQEEFENHMVNEEFIKNFNYEPHQMIGRAVSIVLSPEEPGVSDTTIELMEKYQRPKFKGFSQLLETVTTDVKNKIKWGKKMPKAVVTPIKTIAVGRAKIKEQEEPCPEGEHRNEEGECVKTAEEQEDHGCAEDEEWDGENCVKKQVAEQEQTQQELLEPHVEPPAECADGFEPDGAGGCKPIEWQAEPTADTPAPLIVPEPTIDVAKVPAPPVPAPAAVTGPIIEQEQGTDTPAMEPIPTPPPEGPATITRKCPPNSHWDEPAGGCVPDLIPEQPAGLEGRVDQGATIVGETRLPKQQSLGEPFADYSSFEDCVAKNRGKVDDPEAYCATIKRKTEGETVKDPWLSESFPLVSKMDEEGYIRDIKNAEVGNKQNIAIANIGKATATTSRTVTKHDRDIAEIKTKVPRMINTQGLSESRLRAWGDQENAQRIKAVDKRLTTESQLRIRDDQRILQQVSVLPKTIVESGRASLGYTEKVGQTLLEELQSCRADIQKLGQTFLEAIENHRVYTNKKLGQVATEAKKIKENQVKTTAQLSSKIRGIQEDEHKLVAGLDIEYKKVKQHYEDVKRRVKEQDEELEKRKCGEDEHYDEEQGKCVPNKPPEPEKTEETKKLKETVDSLTTKMENLEAKLTGNFKGKSKPSEMTSEADYSDPENEMRTAARKKK